MTLTEFSTFLVDLPELAPEEAAALPALVKAAIVARRAGVVPTLEQLAVSSLELEAWVEAGRLFEVEQAQRVGLAGAGARGRALVNAEVDGGDAADELLVHQAAEAFAAADAAGARRG